MNIYLNLMLFVGFIGFLLSLTMVVMQSKLTKKGKVTPLSTLSFIVTSMVLTIGAVAPRIPVVTPLEAVPALQVRDANHLKDLITLSMTKRNDGVALTPGVQEDTAASSNTSDSGNSFIDTNVQVEGIKEGDVVKTDGDFIYYASRWDSKIRVMAVAADNQVSYVRTIELQTETETIYTDSMYLTEDYVVVIGYRYTLSSTCATEDDNGDVYFCADFHWWQPTGSVILIDRTTYEIVYTLQTDAAFIDHRIVPVMEGNTIIQETLYLVGHYYFYNLEDAAKLAPTYIENDGDAQVLPFEAMHYIQGDNLYAMTTFTGIPLLENPTEISFNSQGILGTSPDYKKLFVNQDHLYLAQSNYLWEEPVSYQTTTLLQFDLQVEAGTLILKTVGTIRGIAVNQFALDEYQGYFRIATTDTVWNMRANEWWWSLENRTIKNRLYVLQALEDGTFGMVALIEEGLGKPGESIMSVRFQGPLAYVVTFLRTDPLYIIDLTNPALPEIREEIVLPGFDTYQHPWGDEGLIGLGYDADENGMLKGMKLSAYDVREGESDVIQTFLISDYITNAMDENAESVWGWTWAEALWDHRAITVSVEHGIFAFAVNAYSYQRQTQTSDDETGRDVWYNYEFTYHSLYFVFSIDFDAEEPIQLLTTIEHPTSDIGYVQVDRGVIINDVIHTLSNQQMISFDMTTQTILQSLTFPEYLQA